jgi:pantetheine-phosphate adenylyltransferase
MPRIALFPGSFDPITNGHIEIVNRGLVLFDQVIVAVGVNSAKHTMFSPEQRLGWIRQHFAHEPRVSVQSYSQELTVAFARRMEAGFILRGLRNAPDFEYERGIDLLNKHLDPEIETIYLISSPETSHVSSTLVREIIKYRGNLRGVIPDAIIEDLYTTPAPAGS